MSMMLHIYPINLYIIATTEIHRVIEVYNKECLEVGVLFIVGQLSLLLKLFNPA